MPARPDTLACWIRVGRLDIVRCRELGVPFGSRLTKLKEGVPVLSDDGEEVLPSQVCYCRPCYVESMGGTMNLNPIHVFCSSEIQARLCACLHGSLQSSMCYP